MLESEAGEQQGRAAPLLGGAVFFLVFSKK